MKTSDTITTLFSHHLWANLRLLERCADLNSEQMEASIPGAVGSIKETLEHITTSERSYFSRISTGHPYPPPEDAQPMTITDMINSIRTTGQGLIEWAGKVQAEDAVQFDWAGTPREIPKTIILTQVINHASEHREQVKAILTELGIEAPDTSSWNYFGELEP